MLRRVLRASYWELLKIRLFCEKFFRLRFADAITVIVLLETFIYTCPTSQTDHQKLDPRAHQRPWKAEGLVNHISYSD